MKQFIGCDVHKRYSVFVSMDEAGKASRAVRVTHGDGELETYLSGLPAGTPVAVETTGHWYWLLDAIRRVQNELPVICEHPVAVQVWGPWNL